MLKDFFTTQFLFSINRIQIQPVDKIIALIGVIALVIALVFKLGAKFSLNPVDEKYRNKFFRVFIFFGLGELIWYGARVQLIKFFGSHFLALMVFVIVLIWIGFQLWKMFVNYADEKKTWEKEQVKLKYLSK